MRGNVLKRIRDYFGGKWVQQGVWTEYLSSDKADPWRTLLDNFEYNMSFYSWIRNLVPPPQDVIEVGCGSGIMSIIISHYGYRCLGIDVEAGCIALSRRLGKALMSTARFERMDLYEATPKKRFNLAFSSGLFEHLSEEEARRALLCQASFADKIAIVIPSKYCEDVKNDRAPMEVKLKYDISDLWNLVNASGLTPFAIHGYGETAESKEAKKKAQWNESMMRDVEIKYAATICVMGEKRSEIGVTGSYLSKNPSGAG